MGDLYRQLAEATKKAKENREAAVYWAEQMSRLVRQLDQPIEIPENKKLETV